MVQTKLSFTANSSLKAASPSTKKKSTSDKQSKVLSVKKASPKTKKAAAPPAGDDNISDETLTKYTEARRRSKTREKANVVPKSPQRPPTSTPKIDTTPKRRKPESPTATDTDKTPPAADKPPLKRPAVASTQEADKPTNDREWIPVKPSQKKTATIADTVTLTSDSDDAKPATTSLRKSATSAIRQPKVTSSAGYATRVNIKVMLSESSTYAEMNVNFIKAIQEFLACVKQEDEHVSIRPWTSENAHLSDFFADSKFTSFKDVEPYVHGWRARPRKEAGALWVDVFVRHSEEWSSFSRYAGYPLEFTEMEMWKCVLQVEETAEIGWFMFSCQQMDTEAYERRLNASISSVVPKCYRKKIKVGLKFRKVAKSRDLDIQSMPKALHLFVESKYLTITRKIMFMLYGTEAKEFIYGTRMRLIPPFREIKKPALRQAAIRALGKQTNFLKGIRMSFTESILQLDEYDPRFKTCLRDFIADQRANGMPDQPLFHCVGKRYNGAGHVFSFLPQFADQAQSFLEGIVTFAKHLLGPETDGWFQPDAVEAAAEDTWDEKTKSVTTKEDQYLLDVDGFDGDDEYTMGVKIDGFSDTIKEKLSEPPTHRVLKQAEVDADMTVGTFGIGDAAAAAATAAAANAAGHDSDASTPNDDDDFLAAPVVPDPDPTIDHAYAADDSPSSDTADDADSNADDDPADDADADASDNADDEDFDTDANANDDDYNDDAGSAGSSS